MFPYLILGIALVAGLILASRWFVSADPKTLVQGLKWALLGLIGLVAAFFILTGRLAWALFVLPALLPWFFRARQAARAARNFQRMAENMRGETGGEASEIETRYLRVRLDHDSGAISGEVLAGPFSGSRLETLTPNDLLDLYQSCRDDEETVRVLEAYLERAHPDWRDHVGGDSQAAGAGDMDRAEALRVLGLEEGTSAEDIKAAHHRLIAGLHPDKGGSDYLAAQINEAKDVLLGD